MIYLCKNKLGKIMDIAYMIRDKLSEFYDWQTINKTVKNLQHLINEDLRLRKILFIVRLIHKIYIIICKISRNFSILIFYINLFNFILYKISYSNFLTKFLTTSSFTLNKCFLI